MNRAITIFLSLLLSTASVLASDPQQRAKECPSCAEWNAPQQPVRIFANTYWVGPRGLGSILITSNSGHVLIDGALPESAPLIAANVRALGFKIEDVKVILSSHAHFDHAGGIAELQRASGAKVVASASAAKVLEAGSSGPDDPQYGELLSFPPVKRVSAIAEGKSVRIGPITVTAHSTPGHTPGGITWTWRSCEGERCLDFVYADSQTPISADGFSFSASRTYPAALRDFEHSEAVLEKLPCDVLLTPHPGSSRLWERVDGRERGAADALVDRDACRRFAEASRQQLAKRLASERAKL